MSLIAWEMRLNNMNIQDLKHAFNNLSKLPLFEIETSEGFDIVDISIDDNGLIGLSEYGTFHASFDEFDYLENVNDCLDMLLNDLYIQVINAHNDLGILLSNQD